MKNKFYISDIYFYGWNNGVLRHEELFLHNSYIKAFEFFSVHLLLGTARNAVIYITLFNLSWCVCIKDGR